MCIAHKSSSLFNTNDITLRKLRKKSDFPKKINVDRNYGKTSVNAVLLLLLAVSWIESRGSVISRRRRGLTRIFMLKQQQRQQTPCQHRINMRDEPFSYVRFDMVSKLKAAFVTTHKSNVFFRRFLLSVFFLLIVFFNFIIH